MLIAICVILIIIAIGLVRIKPRVYISADILNNKGNIEARLLGIKLYKTDLFFDFCCFEFVLESKEEALKDGNTRRCRKDRRLDPNDPLSKKIPPKKIGELLKQPIVKKIKFNEIRLACEVGSAQNALTAVYGFSTVRIILSAALSAVRAKLGTTVCPKFVPSFSESKFRLKAVVFLEIKIYQIISGIFTRILQKIKKIGRKKKGGV